jgi:hypothetical protein
VRRFILGTSLFAFAGMLHCGLDVVGTGTDLVQDADAHTDPALGDGDATAGDGGADGRATEASTTDAVSAVPMCLPVGAACSSSSVACCAGTVCSTDSDSPSCTPRKHGNGS